MAQYPRIEQIFAKDLSEGDALIFLVPAGSAITPATFELIGGGSAAEVSYVAVLAVDTEFNTSQGWVTHLTLQAAGSQSGLQNTPYQHDCNPLTVATIADGDLNRLVP